MSQSNPKPLRRLTAFRLFGKVNALISRSLESVHSAIFMGLIDDSVFQTYDTYPYGDWDGATELNADTKAVKDWLEVFIAGEITSDSRVLVVGAGGGKELLKLRESGCFVAGIEFDKVLFEETETMLSLCVDGPGVDFRHAERFYLEDVPNDFDVVIVPRFYASLIQGRAERIRFLSACRERLRDGGVIAFDYFTRPDSETSPASLLFKFQPTISNLLRLLRGGKKRRIETGDHLDPQVPLLHHHFNRADLNLELSEGGLVATEHGASWFGWSVAKPVASGSGAKEEPRSLRSGIAAPVPEISHS